MRKVMLSLSILLLGAVTACSVYTSAQVQVIIITPSQNPGSVAITVTPTGGTSAGGTPTTSGSAGGFPPVENRQENYISPEKFEDGYMYLIFTKKKNLGV